MTPTQQANRRIVHIQSLVEKHGWQSVRIMLYVRDCLESDRRRERIAVLEQVNARLAALISILPNALNP